MKKGESTRGRALEVTTCKNLRQEPAGSKCACTSGGNECAGTAQVARNQRQLSTRKMTDENCGRLLKLTKKTGYYFKERRD